MVSSLGVQRWRLAGRPGAVLGVRESMRVTVSPTALMAFCWLWRLCNGRQAAFKEKLARILYVHAGPQTSGH